ncbi:MAG: cyclic lactone autoinducer peptide [Oscillospiraceae bacterium]|nr:cyclic lactone autoinducer peptide [Oscillospiraceae bacterium]
MKKNSVKKMVSKVITKVGVSSAKVDVNQACVYVLYQPKQPKVLKKNDD